MRKITKLMMVVAMVGATALAEEPLTCSLSVSPLKGESTVKKTEGGGGGRGGSKSTTVFERNLKYKAVASFYGQTPEKPVLKVWYIGTGDGGKEMIEVGKAEHPLELDEKRRAQIELASPMAKLVKTKTTTRSGGGGRRGRRGGGSVSTKSETTGDRVTGCVIQVFAGDQLMKSWVSDSRWAKAARNPSFSLELIDPKSARNQK